MNKSERLTDALRTPVVSEKSALLSASNQYVFRISPDADKATVKAAVEQAFKVKVTRVNLVRIHGKSKLFRFRKGKRGDVRKAYVTLAAGQTIDLAAGA